MTAHGISRVTLARVGGAHLSEAPNDPQFTEEQLLAGDLVNNVEKAARAEAKRYVRALDLQIAAEMRGEFNAHGGW